MRMGASLRIIRKRLKLNQGQMAATMGTPTDTYIKVERGLLLATKSTFSSICTALTKYPDHLVTFLESMETPPKKKKKKKAAATKRGQPPTRPRSGGRKRSLD